MEPLDYSTFAQPFKSFCHYRDNPYTLTGREWDIWVAGYLYGTQQTLKPLQDKLDAKQAELEHYIYLDQKWRKHFNLGGY